MTSAHFAQAGAWRRRIALILIALALPLTACFGDGADRIQATTGEEPARVAEFPEWIENVYPPPGSETSVTRAVQVNHNVIAADRQVRLIIDGTDVTAYAVETSPGLLEYDIDQAASPVEIGPGRHSAVVELNRVTPGSGEGIESYEPEIHETLDTYTWTFTVL